MEMEQAHPMETSIRGFDASQGGLAAGSGPEVL